MRYKRVKISGVILVDIITVGFDGHTHCVEGLPVGSKFAYAIPDTDYGIWLVVEHESFPLLQDGEYIPIYGGNIYLDRIKSKGVEK